MTLTQIKRQEMDSQVGLDSHVFWETHLIMSSLGVWHQIWGHHAQLPPGRTSKGKARGVMATGGFA